MRVNFPVSIFSPFYPGSVLGDAIAFNKFLIKHSVAVVHGEKSAVQVSL